MIRNSPASVGDAQTRRNNAELNCIRDFVHDRRFVLVLLFETKRWLCLLLFLSLRSKAVVFSRETDIRKGDTASISIFNVVLI